jgi:Fe-S cluster biosynthesis and repair protein YggX
MHRQYQGSFTKSQGRVGEADRGLESGQQISSKLLVVAHGGATTSQKTERDDPMMKSPRLHSIMRLFSALIITLTTVLSVTTAHAATTYYVATTGSPSGTGTLSNPFQTIQQCAQIAAAGDTCAIRGGVYRETVTPTNSGTAGAPITFTSYNGEAVTISGANQITSNWSVYSGSIYQTTVTLPTSSYNNTGFFANQLFVDSTMMLEARWPNTSLELVTQRTWATAQSGSDATHVVDSAIPNISGGWVGGHIYFRISSGYIAMSSQITAQSSSQLTFDSNTVNTESSQCPGNCMNSGSAYFLFGRLGALDTANEWFYDSSTNKLYLWAPNGGAPANVEYKARVNAFDLSNRSYITVKNIALQAATITTTSSSNTVVVDGISAKYVSHFMTVPYDKSLTGTQYGGIYGAHSNDTGIILAGPNNILKNSTISYSAGNGVAIASGGLVDNNLIFNINYGALYNSAVSPGPGSTITRNTIYNTGRDGITNFSGNTEIGYNHIFDYGYLTKDLAAVYTCCSVDLTGTRIHHNWAHSPRTSALGIGLYIDGGSGNAQLDHNVVWGTSNADIALNTLNSENPVGVNRGNNQVYNNTLASSASIWSNNNNDLIKNNIFRGSSAVNASAAFANNLPASSNPLFVDPAANNYRLNASSPAINYGQVIAGVTDGYVGSAPDAGAYENGGTDWGPPGCSFAGCWQPTNSANKVKNDSFETGSSSNWTWTAGNFAVVGGTGYNGSYAAQVIGAPGGVGQVVTGLAPNTTYELSAWARVGSSGENITIGVKNYGGSELSTATTNTSYSRVVVTFTTGASNSSAEIYMWKASGSGSAWSDDFSVVPANTLPNLVGNPGFESGTLGAWSTWTSAATIVANNARSGTYATRLSGSVVGVEQVISGLSPNTSYTLKGWGRVGTSGESVLIGVKEFGGTEVNDSIATTGYSERTLTFTTGASSTSAKIYIYKHTGAGDAYGDDFSVVPASVPPNLVGNPGFESGSLGAWSTWTSAATIVANNARSGTYATRLSGSVVGVEQVISGLSPNTSYTLKGWGRVGTSGESVLIGVKEFGGTEIYDTITSTSYSERTLTFTTGASSTSAKIYIYKHTGAGDAYGDDFSVVQN